MPPLTFTAASTYPLSASLVQYNPDLTRHQYYSLLFAFCTTTAPGLAYQWFGQVQPIIEPATASRSAQN
ncbi:hypothetical protein K438DRAFT_530097 [Mycena galopus ATCC 62051]|nr:hypothetical protein K438DRAFT_530097 [Mycena galopus ATCC 62051]